MRALVARIILGQPIAVAAIVLLIVASFWVPRIVSSDNIIQVLRQVAVPGIMAIGVTLVVIAGRIDLSIGSLLSLCSVTAVLLHEQIGPGPAIAMVLAIGLISGCVSGFVVAYMQLNSLIATLGMMSILQGAAYVATGGIAPHILHPETTWFKFFGRSYLLGIPVQVLLLVALTFILWLLLNRTTFGRRIFAVGGGEVASVFSAINSRRVIFFTFVISGLMTSVAAIVLASRVMSSQTTVGSGYELSVLSAVFLGGTSMIGGAGGVGRTLLGVAILGFLGNAFILFGAPYYTQWIVSGVIIVLAVWFGVGSRRGTVFA